MLGSIADKVLRASGLPMLMYRPAAVESDQAAVHATGFPALTTADI